MNFDEQEHEGGAQADEHIRIVPDDTGLEADGPERTDPEIEHAVHAPPAIEHAAPVGGVETDFTDTLTLAFADPQASIYGVIALERAAVGSAGALLIADGAEVASHVRSDLPADQPQWQDLATDALWIETGPAAWTVQLKTPKAELAVEFLPLADPFVFAAQEAPAHASGLQRSERLCRVAGTAKVNGRERGIDARGQRSHQWGPSPWTAIAQWRSLAVWIDGGPSLSMWGITPTGAASHDLEALAARVAEGDPPHPVIVDDPRVSTTYDAEGRPLRAGLELWIGSEDPVARRAAGERVSAGSLVLASSRQDWSFLEWRMDGAAGAGVLAHASPVA